MSSDWYARRLAQQAQIAPPQPRRFEPQQFQPQQPHLVPGYQQQPQYQQPHVVRPEEASLVYQGPGSFLGVRSWRGGEASRKNPDPCPQCGGNQYFTALQSNKRLPPPAPHCYNCGYNGGMFDQGDPVAWGAA